VRIFEPFFSTKGPKGSGLGLAVAYSVITRRGGQIAVESVVDEGTTFTLTLPYVPIGAAPEAEEVSRPAPRRTALDAKPVKAMPEPAANRLGGARILVVDDEPGLMLIVRQFMERSGASVVTASGGKAALEVLEAPGPKLDLVITDLDMPEVDGWAVAAAVKSHSPGTQVVMLTGWAGEITPDDAQERGVDLMLAKPCSRADLEAAVRGLLASKSTPSNGFDVLLVDDQPVFAKAVRDLLVLQGHDVTVVESAPAALEAIAARPFDIVLTDYSLGEVSGAELAERLVELGSSAYVVLITGYATEIDDPSLLTRGVDAVLPKPCRGEDLREVLGRVHSGR
jgi:CheY-like chemotaxis protein